MNGTKYWIPYFRVPVKVPPSHNDEVLPANIPRPGCPQKDFYIGDHLVKNYRTSNEDCLHLNVWTPCTEDTEPGCRKTVIVFFFSHGFQNGDNNLYDGSYLASLGDVVFVFPNFRLGAFGFLDLGKVQCVTNMNETIKNTP